MSLTFLTPLMLAGAALVAAPIILHLVMRQQPKHLIFPALQFIRQRSSSNRRKLKLRHLILLALRCAAIVFLALALARPSLQATGWLGDQEAPIAAAIVFDTSPRMQYRHQNQTRLEVAQEVAQRVLKQLPRESDVAVLDSRTLEAAFSIDAAVARQKITRLGITAAAQPLPELCSQGLRLVSESSRGRKEVYVFTDLGRQAWSAEAGARLREKLADKTDVALYIIDVGVEDPKDLSLGDLRTSAESLAKNSPLSLQTELVADGAAADDRGVAIYTIDPSSGELQLRSQSPAKATPEQPQPVDFQIDGLELGVHQGVVRIAGEDSLPTDDSRYFTVDVRPPWKVLVVAPKPVERHASLLTEPISPTPFRRTGQARFECDVIGFDELAAKSLDDYAAVCLLDPPPLTDAVWQSLAGFAERGGGVAIWLGRHAQPQGRSVDDFNTAASQAVMPGKISPHLASARCVFGAGRLSTSHAGEIPRHYRGRAVGRIHGRFPLAACRLRRRRESDYGVQQRPAGDSGKVGRQGARARVHYADFRRSQRTRSVEHAGHRQRALAIFHVGERSDVVPCR